MLLFKRIIKRNKVTAIFLASLFAVSILILSGCGNRISESYVCGTREDHSWLDMNPDGTSMLFFNNDRLAYGKYKWDRNKRCYYLTMKSDDNKQEVQYVVVPDENDVFVVFVSGGIFSEEPFYKCGDQEAINEHRDAQRVLGY